MRNSRPWAVGDEVESKAAGRDGRILIEILNVQRSDRPGSGGWEYEVRQTRPAVARPLRFDHNTLSRHAFRKRRHTGKARVSDNPHGSRAALRRAIRRDR